MPKEIVVARTTSELGISPDLHELPNYIIYGSELLEEGLQLEFQNYLYDGRGKPFAAVYIGGFVTLTIYANNPREGRQQST